MNPADIEEFAADVRLRLIENDYAILRKFQHRSSFPTFLTGVVTWLLYDYRVRQFGKTRSSAEARRMGHVAVELERLLHRDGLSREAAFRVLAAHHPDVTRQRLEAMADRLPQRIRWTVVPLEDEATIAATTEQPDVARMDHPKLAERISGIVESFITQLPPPDRLLLKLLAEGRHPMADIARVLGVEAKPLYRRRAYLLRELRKALQASGIESKDVDDLIGDEADWLLDFGLDKNIRPSNEEDATAHSGEEID